MFNLKIIIRNLCRGGIYSAINVGGLAIGMAAAILILAWIYHEWSYDRFHAKEKQLYITYSKAVVSGSFLCHDATPFPLGPTLKTDYPNVAKMARMLDNTFLFANDNEKFNIKIGVTDPDFITMFDFPLLSGNRETALNDSYSVILTEKAAKRLFGIEDPMGQTLLVNDKQSVTISGIMKDLPDNTKFKFEALIPMDLLKSLVWYNDSWTNFTLQTYVELHDNISLDLVNESIRNLANAHTNNTAQTELFFYPLNRQHLFGKFENGIPVGGLVDTLMLYGVVVGLIILIACINYVNLNTARSEKRAKEVGVRKVMGGKRSSLIALFLSESILVSFIAGCIAFVLVVIATPMFNTMMGQQIILNPLNGRFLLAGLGFVILTGVLAGIYPAFFLSKFLPVKVLKGLFKRKQAFVSSRKVLVVVQFTVTCVLMVSTLVIYRQIRYAQNRESGYSKDQLIYSRLEGDIDKNYALIKHDLLNSGTALSVTKTMAPMTQRWSISRNVEWQGKDPDTMVAFDLYFTDADWTKTVGADIIEGRDIDVYTYPTDSTAMLLNESAVKIMNLENPIGEIVKRQGLNWHVVGVVKDFIINSPYETIAPMLIGGTSGWFNNVHIKLNGNNRMADNLQMAQQIFKQYNPVYPFEFQFIDEEYAYKFRHEQKMGTLAVWFTGLTIFISCLGLFALVAYLAETRRKEIGIRKVLGAAVSSIVFLLSKEFLILVVISVMVASPIAWWAMNQWLANYAYRTNIPWWLFIAVGIISLGIALLTVGFQAIRAATENPVKAIKSE